MLNDFLEKNKIEFKRWIVDNEQGRVDLKILPYLKDIENGFFVEAGALDGLFMSNTKILEDLGWKGLLIEPSPKAVEKCRQNRISPVESCALVAHDSGVEKVGGDFFFDGEGGMGAWSGVHRSAYGIKAAVIVPAYTLDFILNKHKISKIDFLSLDVEGFEMEVLRGVDLNKIDITYMLIEVNTHVYSLKELEGYLFEYGYKNLGCLSNFTNDMEGWNGSHQDYLFKKNG